MIGTPEERAPLERVVNEHFLPFTAITPAMEGGELPVLEGRSGGGQAYVCVNMACQLPTRSPKELEQHLREL